MIKQDLLILKELLKEAFGVDYEYIFKNNTWAKITNGSFVPVTGKPAIKSEMYYNDEFEAPDLTYEDFEKYNLRTNFRDFSEKLDTASWNYEFIPFRGANTKNDKLLTIRITTDENYNTISNEDVDIIKRALAEAKQKYQKRLKAYWKRYSGKVTSVGYYANR